VCPELGPPALRGPQPHHTRAVSEVSQTTYLGSVVYVSGIEVASSLCVYTYMHCVGNSEIVC
jgi:hypothetical protein